VNFEGRKVPASVLVTSILMSDRPAIGLITQDRFLADLFFSAFCGHVRIKNYSRKNWEMLHERLIGRKFILIS